MKLLIFLKLCSQYKNIYKNFWQKHKFDGKIKQINYEKKLIIILEMRCDYQVKISVLLNYLKS